MALKIIELLETKEHTEYYYKLCGCCDTRADSSAGISTPYVQVVVLSIERRNLGPRQQVCSHQLKGKEARHALVPAQPRTPGIPWFKAEQA